MKYILDHDFHIHSKLSPCSNDPEQTPENILKYAIATGKKDIVLTDHVWDAAVPCAEATWQGFEHTTQALPLPQAESVRFHFGCEVDMDRYSVIGVSRKACEKLDFIIVPLNHLHLGFAKVQKDDAFDKKEQANILCQRFQVLLQSGLPFHKTGVAHLTWDFGLNGGGANRTWQDHIDIINYVSDARWRELFRQTAELGLGVELNDNTKRYVGEDQQSSMLRPYQIAKECGCKFYFGSDAHHLKDFDALQRNYEFFLEKLNLTEDDKFRPFKDQ